MIESLIKNIDKEVGKTHTLEIHPHIDHLYRVKDIIKQNDGSMHVSQIKKQGLNPNILKDIPRDGKGRVTTQDIDKHIESLPKTKVNVKIARYTGFGGEQVHRKNPEYTIIAQMHPDEKNKMSDVTENKWDSIKDRQHDVGDSLDTTDQIGWIRVDPHHNKESTPQLHNHWHLDEIQSDFTNKNKIQIRTADNNNNNNDNNDIFNHLSMGHDDPQHALHSIANQLGRKLSIESTSMDTPEDQAKKNGIRDKKTINKIDVPYGQRFDKEAYYDRRINEGSLSSRQHKEQLWESTGKHEAEQNMSDPDFKSAVDKLGGIPGLKKFTEIAHHQTHGGMFEGEIGQWNEDGDHVRDLHDNFDKMNNDEKNELSEFLLRHHGKVRGLITDDEVDAAKRMHDEEYHDIHNPDREPEKIIDIKPPVHQQNTYKKRPKKLGFKNVDKDELLGSSDGDSSSTVQYSKLYKKLDVIEDLLKKVKNGKIN